MRIIFQIQMNNNTNRDTNHRASKTQTQSYIEHKHMFQPKDEQKTESYPIFPMAAILCATPAKNCASW